MTNGQVGFGTELFGSVRRPGRNFWPAPQGICCWTAPGRGEAVASTPSGGRILPERAFPGTGSAGILRDDGPVRLCVAGRADAKLPLYTGMDGCGSVLLSARDTGHALLDHPAKHPHFCSGRVLAGSLCAGHSLPLRAEACSQESDASWGEIRCSHQGLQKWACHRGEYSARTLGPACGQRPGFLHPAERRNYLNKQMSG